MGYKDYAALPGVFTVCPALQDNEKQEKLERGRNLGNRKRERTERSLRKEGGG